MSDDLSVDRVGVEMYVNADTVAGRRLSDSELRACRATEIRDLQLSPRATAVVNRLGLMTVEELASAPLGGLVQLANCGLGTVFELRVKVLRTADSSARKLDWVGSIVGRALSGPETKALRGTTIAELRLPLPAVGVATALRACSALDVALAQRKAVLAFTPHRGSYVLRQCGLAVSSVLSDAERRSRDDLRTTLKGLEPRRGSGWPLESRAVEGIGSTTDCADDGSLHGHALTAQEEAVCRATPVKLLGLSVRAANVVNTRGLATAFDIARANREELAQSKNCGQKTIRELRQAVVETLEGQGRVIGVDPGHPADSAGDGSIHGRTLTAQEEAACRATPVKLLGLSVRAANVVNARGLATASDIARANREELAQSKNCGRKTIQELRHAVVKTLEVEDGVISVDPGHPEEVKAKVVEMLSKLDSRSRLVLEQRFGLWDGDRKTLEEIGALLELTRERVRQIEAKAIKTLRGSFASKVAIIVLRQVGAFYLDPARSPSFAGVLTGTDVERVRDFRGRVESGGSGIRTIAARFLIGVFDEDLEEFPRGLAVDGHGRWFATETAAKRFQSIEAQVQTLLAGKGRPIPIDDLVTRLSAIDVHSSSVELKRLASLSTEIGLSAGALVLRHWRTFRRGPAVVRIERALAELGKPTHHSYISEKLNFMFPDKAPFNGHAIMATMARYPDVFVSLGRGTYALRNWGVSRPPYVKDFVIESMKRAGGQATIEQVAELGARKFGFKESSIAMTMSLHPTFFKRIRGTLYKLL